MAASDAKTVPEKNVAYRHYFAIRKNDGTLITSWTGADSERSLDGATFADCTNEATEIGTSGIGYLDLTASEMNTDATVLKVTVTNTDALPYVVTFFPDAIGELAVGAPSATPSLRNAVMLMYMALEKQISGRHQRHRCAGNLQRCGNQDCKQRHSLMTEAITPKRKCRDRWQS